MNRIYQGRINKIEILSEDRKNLIPIDTFEDRELDQTCPLWQHHEIFQDAVNYYLLCLAALARGQSNLTADPTPQQRLASDLLERLEKSWNQFPKTVSGPAKPKSLLTSLGKWLNLGLDSSLKDAEKLVLDENDASPELRAKAFNAFLSTFLPDKENKNTDGKVRNAAKNLELFVLKQHAKAYPFEGNVVEQNAAKKLIPTWVHISSPLELSNRLEFHHFAKINKKSALRSPEDSKERLVQAITSSVDDEPEKLRLLSILEKLPCGFQIPNESPGTVKKQFRKKFDAFLVLKYVEACESILGLLRTLEKKPSEMALSASDTSINTSKASVFLWEGGDPILAARSNVGYVFRAFTSLDSWNGDGAGTWVWKDFDIAAFQEALTALNQFSQKTIERTEKRNYLKGKIAILLGSHEPGWKAATTESGEPEDLPKPLDPILLALADRLEARLTEELADTVVDHKSPKPLRFGQIIRTLIPGQWQLSSASLRGFLDIAGAWNKLLKQRGDDVTENDLAAIVKEHQRNDKNKKSIGSITLFLALCDPEFWPLWRNEEITDEDASKAANNRFLYRIVDLHQAICDFERAKEAVNLTPAEPRHSRRLYMFADKKVVFKSDSILETSLAVHEQDRCSVRRVRLTYSAPRLKRDELTGGDSSQWLQPMAKALGYTGEEISKKFESAVSLMPDMCKDGNIRFLINFPKFVDSAPLQKFLGKSMIWNGQFNGVKDKNIHLHWPATASTKPAKENPWWKNPDILKNGFTLHSVDLGQRTAGAWALIKVTPWKPETTKPIRSIGHCDTHAWYAEILSTGMHRLPGEDQKVLDAQKKMSREQFGKAGRNSSIDEYNEAIALCQKLGCANAEEAKNWIGKTPTQKSLPEQNDALLTLANRRLSRLATFHRWSCLHHALTEKSGDSKTQLRIIAATLAELTHWQDEDVTTALKSLLSAHPYLADLFPEATPESSGTKDKTRATTSWTAAQHAQWLSDFQPHHFAKFSEYFGNTYSSYREKLLTILVALANRVSPMRKHIWKWQPRLLDKPDAISYGELIREENRHDKTPHIRGQRGLSMVRLEQLETLRTLFLRINRAMDKLPGKPSQVGFGFTSSAGEPCDLLLEKIENMKEQRVNQTAHLILAQALGLRLKTEKTDVHTRREKDIHGEYEKIPGRQPADFIVIENLDRYLTSQGRAPTENRRLMKWAHRAVRDKIKMLAEEPFGINIVEAPAAYSSRFCALTGAPGSRCIEKSSIDPFLREQLLKKTKNPPNSGHPDLRALYLTITKQFEAIEKANSEKRSLHTLILPKPGGPLFLGSVVTPLTQADANAAINIGLRGIAAPDAIHILHKIRTQTHQDILYAGKRKHAEKNAREKAAFPERTAIQAPPQSKSGKGKGSPNFFHLPAVAQHHYPFGQASMELSEKTQSLVSGVALHTITDAAVLERIVNINAERLKKWGLSTSYNTASINDPDDDIPMHH